MDTLLRDLPDAAGEFRFGPAVADEGRALLGAGAEALFQRLAADVESQPVRWAARALIDGVLNVAPGPADEGDDASGDELFVHMQAALQAQRAAWPQALRDAAARGGRARRALLLERAPVRALAGAWLDGVSTPATQPAPLVNRLLRARLAEQFGGDYDGAAPQWLRHEHVLAEVGLALPGVERSGFVPACGAGEASLMLGAFYRALALYGASCLPEIVAVHWVHHALGVDAQLGGAADRDDAAAAEAEACARDCLRAWRGQSRFDPWATRLATAVRACLRLEALQAEAMHARLQQLANEDADEQVARIVARHAAHAGKQHGAVRIGGRPLHELLDARPFDAGAFLRSLKASPFLKPALNSGPCRFIAALDFGGPMFGIFGADEQRALSAWAARGQAEQAAGDEEASAPAPSLWERIVGAAHSGARYGVSEPADDARSDARLLFHMLVNIERFACVLPLALAIAREGLTSAARLLRAPDHGGLRYTDPRFFRYSRAALEARMQAIHDDKLVRPFVPLAAIPCADEVVFKQKTFALGNLIDGAWAYRAALRGRHRRAADVALLRIYGDEMGNGIVERNHIELIRRVLASMDVALPHIASQAFVEQEELLDELYPFALFQLSLAQFPDTLRAEILGFNLGIEMFGLGELRLHEIQKLRHWGFDTAYETTHLSIDNLGSGHARVSLDAVTGHLEEVAQQLGADAQQREWERVWTGYAAFAQFVERSDALPQDLSDYVI